MALTKVTNSMIVGAPVSVDDYGADPTGVLDSTTAIQAAFNTNRSVVFGASGTYKISGDLTLGGNNRTIALMGASLLFQRTVLTITATDTVIDLGGGILSQECGFATVAVETTASGNTITVTDSSTLRIGQLMASSWGDATNGQYPLTPPTPFNTLDARVQSIAGNVVTLNKNMLGAVCTLPVNLTVGEFAFAPFISNACTNVLICNGTIKRAVGFYTFVPATAPEFGSTTFENIYFESNGVDQFSVQRKHTLTFNSCNLNQQWDAAKQGIVWKGDARVYINDSFMALGNHDNAFLFINENDGVVQTGYSRLIASNSNIVGTAAIPGPIAPGKGSWEGDVLYVVEATDPGTIEKIVFEGCDIQNFKRSFLTGSANNRTENIVIAEIRVDNCSIDANFSYYIFDGVGAGFNCPNCNVSNTSFYQDVNGTVFHYVAAINGAVVSFRPVFDNCYFKLDNDSAQFATPAVVRNSTFTATPYKHSSGIVEMQNCLFQNGSSIAISPAFSDEFYGDIESIIVDDPDFPANPAGFITIAGGATFNGARVASARSINGQSYYNVYKQDVNVRVSGTFFKSDGVYFLRGDDYCIPIGSQIVDMYLGTTQRVTFNLITALASAAASGATSIVVSSATSVAIGDLVNVVLTNGLVDTKVVAGTYAGGTTIPLTSGLDSAAASGNAVNFFRVV
jgi:hypothetical protein